MLWLILFLYALTMALVCGCLAALEDLRALRIPNVFSLIIFLMFPLAYAMMHFSGAGYDFHLLSRLGVFVGVFVLTYILFALRILGGGDAKMITAFAPWVGINGLMTYFFYMALSGAFLAFLALVIGRLPVAKRAPPASWPGVLAVGKKDIPYGVAIFIGAAAAFIQLGYLDRDMWETFLK